MASGEKRILELAGDLSNRMFQFVDIFQVDNLSKFVGKPLRSSTSCLFQFGKLLNFVEDK